MLTRKVLTAAAILAVVGLGVAGYATRDRWLPFVVPDRSEAEADDHIHEDHPAHADRVKLSPQARANLKLDVGPLTPEPYWRTLLIPGVVVDQPGESDHGVTTRLAGVVTDIKARPGDTVRPGDPLFTLQLVSEFVHSAQAELARAAQELRLATAKRDRTAELVKLGTQTGATLVEDEAQVKRFAAQVQTYRRQLQAFGLTVAQVDQAEKGELITDVTITAPRLHGHADDPPAGTGERPAEGLYEVQDLKVHLGEQVQAGETLCTLANHQRLFVEGRAFKSEAAALARAAERRLPVTAEFADEAPGDWPPQGPLVVHHLANTVDPDTRTFAFYLPLANQPKTFERGGKTFFVWRYRPGQRVRLRVPVENLGDAVFVLPAGAVVREGPEAYAFVQNGDLFARKPVRVLFEDQATAVVANDGSVGPGQFVARNQAAALNRTLKAAAAGGEGGHGHDHGHEH